MISLEEAIELASPVLKVALDDCSSPATLTRVQLVHSGWIFYYDTVQAVVTGDWRHRLGGNLPIFVSHEQEVTKLAINSDLVVSGPMLLGRLTGFLDSIRHDGLSYEVKSYDADSVVVTLRISAVRWEVHFHADKRQLDYFRFEGSGGERVKSDMTAFSNAIPRE